MEKKERRLYVLSDTHLELRTDNSAKSINIFPKEGDARNFLAFCGDIGNPFDSKYFDFIQRHSQRFEHIFVVSGNHEYYSKKKGRLMNQVDNELRRVCAEFPNVHFLQLDTFDLDDDFVFAGCTLWTPVTKEAETWMRDYESIYKDENVKVESYDILEKNGMMSDWLEQILKKRQDNKKVIVLTHHAPSEKMLSNKDDDRNNFEETEKCMYCSFCDDLFQPPLFLWLSGHTHYSHEIEINQIPSASNCWGYPGQKTKCDTQKYFLF